MKYNHCYWAKNDWIYYHMKATTWARQNISKVTASMTISPMPKNWMHYGCRIE